MSALTYDDPPASVGMWIANPHKALPRDGFEPLHAGRWRPAGTVAGDELLDAFEHPNDQTVFVTRLLIPSTPALHAGVTYALAFAFTDGIGAHRLDMRIICPKARIAAIRGRVLHLQMQTPPRFQYATAGTYRLTRTAA